MGVEELRQQLLHQYGIRVEPQMGEYVLRRLQQAGAALRELPIIGGEARTGAPVRLVIDPAALRQDRAIS